MSRVLPILFNTDMVRAILGGRKTVTRRCVKPKSRNACGFYVTFRKHDNAFMGVYDYDENEIQYDCSQTPPCQLGDILYVRETWSFMPCIGCNGEYARLDVGMNCYDVQAVEYDDGDSISDGCFVYHADCRNPKRITWRPSIHMPKQAARIWLKVTDVRVERLQDMNLEDFLNEGVVVREEFFNDPENAYGQARMLFKNIWNYTIKEPDWGIYGWDANPYTWVIEFERCKKPEFTAP